MKIEEKKKLQEEFYTLSSRINTKNGKIRNSSEYQKLENEVKPLRMEKEEPVKEIDELRNKVYEKYGWYLFYGYSDTKLKDIKPCVKQGVKRALGVGSVAEIEDYLVRIVKELIEKELDTPRMKELVKKVNDLDKIIKEKYNQRNKLIIEGAKSMGDRRDEILKELNQEAKRKADELGKKKKDVKIKVDNLPKYLEKITKEVNRQLILDGIKS